MAKKKGKIVAHVKDRDPHKFYYVDRKGDVIEMDRPKRRKKR